MELDGFQAERIARWPVGGFMPTAKSLRIWNGRQTLAAQYGVVIRNWEDVGDHLYMLSLLLTLGWWMC